MNRIVLRRFRCVVAVVMMAAAFLPGCKRATAKPESPPSSVTVSRPLQRDVIRWDEYSGYLSSPKTVIVNARVSGLIEEAPFQEGQLSTRATCCSRLTHARSRPISTTSGPRWLRPRRWQNEPRLTSAATSGSLMLG